MHMQSVKNGIYFIFLILFLSNTSQAQKNKDQEKLPPPVLPMDKETGLISYTKVVEVQGVSKKELYNRALSWAKGFYKNPTDVIRERDTTEGKIICKARFKIYSEPDKKGFTADHGDVMYTLTMRFREGRYRYEITKVNWQQISYYAAERWQDVNSQTYDPVFAHYLRQTDEKLKEVVASLEKSIATAPKVKKDDW
jgi:hypothetical protein